MPKRLTHLGDLPVQEFLRDYWQKRPLLIRNAFPGFESPLDGDELAGLALDEDVESRLVLEHGETHPWEVWRGPFNEEQFAQLPSSHWTLLVQAVDQWVPEVRELLQAFRFIPDWRLDDVMVSFAPDQGSVGPHFDYYDVFLLQGAGRRRWRIGQSCDDQTPQRTDTPLKILNDFQTEQEWLLEPGDMLYIPPGIAHWGIAEGHNLTYSIGFRAPSHGEVLSELGPEIADTLSDALRYGDADLSMSDNPGYIGPDALERVQAVLETHLTPENLIRWFGGYMTEPKYPELEYHPDKPIDASEWQSPDAVLERHPAARFAYFPKAGGESLLFVDGLAYPCPETLARCLCEHWTFADETLQSLLALEDPDGLIAQLVNQGSLLLQKHS